MKNYVEHSVVQPNVQYYNLLDDSVKAIVPDFLWDAYQDFVEECNVFKRANLKKNWKKFVSFVKKIDQHIKESTASMQKNDQQSLVIKNSIVGYFLLSITEFAYGSDTRLEIKEQLEAKNIGLVSPVNSDI